jgi:hypothetical protein
LLFTQPANYREPRSFTNTDGTPITRPGYWNVAQYVQQANLAGPVAASLFTVENGQPSAGVSVVSASRINTASVSSAAARATSTGDAPTLQQFASGVLLLCALGLAGAVVLAV